MSILNCGPYQLDLGRPRVMAIINITPDSFSGDGLLHDRGQVLAHAERAVEAGADMLDVGGESSRPGAQPVGEQEELDRVLPVLEVLVGLGLPVSVDTFKPAVMRAALSAGASMINDINALRAPGAIEAVAASKAAVCVMHMQGEPRTMQLDPVYSDVVGEVGVFLDERVRALAAAGIAEDRVVVDPGFGFGKSVDHNLAMLRGLSHFAEGGRAVLAGLSRKSMFGAITGRAPGQRLASSIAAALIAAQNGARIVRVHDVAETCDALRLWEAVRSADGGEHPARFGSA